MRRIVFVGFMVVASLLTGWLGFGTRPTEEATPVASTALAIPIPPQASTPPTTSPIALIPDPTVPTTIRPPEPPPFPDLVCDLAAHMQDRRLADLQVSVSVWVEGSGVVFSQDPELELYPASNEKLLTGVGALGLLASDFRFFTELALSDDDLILVAGGDPTLTRANLDESAAAVAGQVTDIKGSLVVDATRYGSARMAPGWQDWQMPTYVGPLSTFMVDDNRHRTDDAYLADPDLGNAELLRAALERAGVTIVGPTVLGSRPARARMLVTLESADRNDLVKRLLTHSDNEIAEALVREIGFVTAGQGTTLAGLTAIESYVATLGLDLIGEAGDGSGLSRADLRSAGEWQELIVTAQDAEWWPIFFESMAVAGKTGTMAERLGDGVTAGNVHAKTGSSADAP